MLRILPLADDLILPQAKQDIYFFNRIGQKQLPKGPGKTAAIQRIRSAALAKRPTNKAVQSPDENRQVAEAIQKVAELIIKSQT